MAARIFHRSVPLLVALALAALPASGQQRDATIGAQGELYQVHEGAYGELFPGQNLADPANSALALDVTYPDQSHERFLVPDSESDDVDSNASVLFEGNSGNLYLLWKSQHNVIHTLLNLVSFHDGEWGEPIEISGNPFGWKGSPQFAVTRDTFHTIEDDGSLRTWARTVVHLLWWEEVDLGEPAPFYSPVTLIDGEYTGSNQVYRLDELLADALGSPAPVAPNFDLARALKIEAGANANSATVGFVDPSSGQLVSATLQPIPGEIGSLADRIRAQIIRVGSKLAVGQPGALAGQIRDQVAYDGTLLGFHPSVTNYLAAQVFSGVSSADPAEPMENLADKIRAQIIRVGARLTGGGIGQISAKDSFLTADLPTSESGTTGPAGQMRILVTSVRPSPQTGSDDVALHLSRNGRAALVSWVDHGVVNYRESQGEGWSAPHLLHLGVNLDLAHARQILDQRADERCVE